VTAPEITALKAVGDKISVVHANQSSQTVKADTPTKGFADGLKARAKEKRAPPCDGRKEISR
jgi:hypothetical protein